MTPGKDATMKLFHRWTLRCGHGVIADKRQAPRAVYCDRCGDQREVIEVSGPWASCDLCARPVSPAEALTMNLGGRLGVWCSLDCLGEWDLDRRKGARGMGVGWDPTWGGRR